VNRCSLGESYHFFEETCCLCRQSEVLPPLRCRYLVPARTGTLTPSLPQVFSSQKVVSDTFAAIRSSDLNRNRPIQPLPELRSSHVPETRRQFNSVQVKIDHSFGPLESVFTYTGSPVEIQSPKHCEPMGRNMTALYPVFSPIGCNKEIVLSPSRYNRICGHSRRNSVECAVRIFQHFFFRACTV
jgi:hypothetical protein